MSELIKHNPICKEASRSDYDCEDCSRVDDAGQAECCMQPCNYILTCDKVCAQKRKFDEMSKFDTKKLLERLQDYLLSKDDVIPFSFDILHDRILASEQQNAELQAQCAAMRQALEAVKEVTQLRATIKSSRKKDYKVQAEQRLSEVVRMRKNALSTTAGADLLQRVRELEQANTELIQLFEDAVINGFERWIMDKYRKLAALVKDGAK